MGNITIYINIVDKYAKDYRCEMFPYAIRTGSTLRFLIRTSILQT